MCSLAEPSSTGMSAVMLLMRCSRPNPCWFSVVLHAHHTHTHTHTHAHTPHTHPHTDAERTSQTQAEYRPQLPPDKGPCPQRLSPAWECTAGEQGAGGPCSLC